MNDSGNEYKLTDSDKKDRDRALDEYYDLQKSRDKALSILSSSGIAFASAMLTTEFFRTASLIIKVGMLFSMGCFVVVILALVISYLFSEYSYETYIKEIDKGNKISGRDNVYTKRIALCNAIMLASFVLGVITFSVVFCFLVLK